MKRSFVVKYHSLDNKPLIGGVMASESCRYQRKIDAEAKLSQVIKVNGSRCAGKVLSSSKYPEIFVHCGQTPQAVGGKCVSCGKVLTVADAKKAAPMET